jgi:hypothetical protein
MGEGALRNLRLIIEHGCTKKFGVSPEMINMPMELFF